jgi:hypothetical protein
MVYGDGECPSCGHERLCLNTGDLLECPRCHLVCANTDGVLATVMPFLGDSKFRFDDGRLPRMSGVGFARAKGKSVMADVGAMFTSRLQLQEYIRQLQPLKPREEAVVLWEKFLAEFARHVSAVEPDDLMRVWASRPARTDFYKKVLMPQVAAALTLKHGKEKFTVDYVMSMDRGDCLVPKVFIESENAIDGAGHEIEKLCSLNSPLRVLITVRNGWKDIGPNAKAYGKLRDWQATIRGHSQANQHYSGVIGIIVGSRFEKKVVFRSCAFGADGDLVTPLLEMAEVG